MLLVVLWFGVARHRFVGPPHGTFDAGHQAGLRAAEQAVHQQFVSAEPLPDTILPERDSD
jgi:hypothetical protein